MRQSNNQSALSIHDIPTCYMPPEIAAKIPTAGSYYTNDQRIRAAALFLTVGNLKKTAEIIGIPQGTVYDWSKCEWWHDLTQQLQDEQRQELDSGFTRIIRSAIQVIETRLENDEVSAKDAAVIMGVTFDKRQILNMRATSITGKAMDINTMQGEFQRFLAAKEVKIEAVIDSASD